VTGLIVAAIPAFSQWHWRGNFALDTGYQTDVGKRYFEQKLEASLLKNKWEFGIKYEMFDPAKPQSMMGEDDTSLHQFVDFKGDKLHVRMGSFYTVFGRGLVLRGYDHPAIGLDRKIEGLLVEYKMKHLDLKGLKGEIYGVDREVHRPIQGGEARLKLFSVFTLGKTYVKTDFSRSEDLEWGSWFLEMNFNSVILYGEHATDEREDEDQEGTADYASLNVFLGPVSILGEWKDYDKYQKADGLVFYNDPPTLVQEHRFVLWNKHGYSLNAWDEEGYLVKVDTPVGSDGVLTLQHDFTEMHLGYDVFQETYGIFEWDFPNEVETFLIAGTQEDFVYEYKNIGMEFQFPLKTLFIGMIVESQKRESIWVDDFDESQALTMDVTLNPRHILSLIFERTTSDESDKSSWLGLKYGARIGQNLELSFFCGSRRKGKICAGGVCVYTPEFEGIEARGTYRFGS